MIHTYWLKNLTLLHERLAAQMNQLLMDGTHRDWLAHGWTVLIMKDPQKGGSSTQLLANNLPLHNMEAPVAHHSG